MIERIANHPLLQLFLAHIRELVREPGVIFWGIVFPILMSLGLGVAFTQKKEVVSRIAVVASGPEKAGQPSPGGRLSALFTTRHAVLERNSQGEWVRKIRVADGKLGTTIFVFSEMKWEEAMVLLKRGTLNLVYGETAGMPRYHFDPMNPDAQLTYLKLSRLIGTDGPAPPSTAGDVEPLTVTGTRYIDFLVPGLIAMGVMMSSLWGVSYAIIERRSKKLLRRMVATPMRRSHFLLALISVRVLMNFVEAGLLFLFAWLVFGITVQGSVAALLVLFAAGNFVFAGIGILTASRTAKTEVGNGLINAISMPMMVLSGVFFSYHNFPEWSIAYIRAMPLTMLADGLRSIMTVGAGFAQVGLPALVLAVTGLVLFTAGMKMFRWH